MGTGAITEYIDVAQIALYLFWVFFAGLIFYLRREDKREGYPLESDRSEHIRVEGFPAMPAPKRFALAHGGIYAAPHPESDDRAIHAEPAAPWPGAPLQPTGDPMRDGVGPAAWAQREDRPDLTIDGDARIVPMRVATDFWVEEHGPDPRGMEVVGVDGGVAGRVDDIWVDRSEPQVRYLEVELDRGGEPGQPGEAPASPSGPERVLLPITMARVEGGRGRVRVASIRSDQFAGVPSLSQPDQVTLREEDRICAYYASGHLYALPSRQEALL